MGTIKEVFFSFPAVASPTYDDHLDTSFDDYSNYVDGVSFRLCTATAMIFMFQQGCFQAVVFILGRRKC